MCVTWIFPKVDYKSFLLDFKSLPNEEASSSDLSQSYGRIESEADVQPVKGHYTMEFFEMCASLITQLAR